MTKKTPRKYTCIDLWKKDKSGCSKQQIQMLQTTQDFVIFA
jgi:hypothetical protein